MRSTSERMNPQVLFVLFAAELQLQTLGKALDAGHPIPGFQAATAGCRRWQRPTKLSTRHLNYGNVSPPIHLRWLRCASSTMPRHRLRRRAWPAERLGADPSPYFRWRVLSPLPYYAVNPYRRRDGPGEPIADARRISW